MRDQPFQGTAMQGDKDRILYRPAEATGGQAEGGSAGQADYFLRRDRAGEQRADAIEERIAGRNDADRRASRTGKAAWGGDGQASVSPEVMLSTMAR